MKLYTKTRKLLVKATLMVMILVTSYLDVAAQIDYTQEGIQVTGSSQTSNYGINVKNMNGVRFVNVNPNPIMIPQPAVSEETVVNNGK